MISLAPTHPGPSRELLDHEGGFLWWYAEALDEAGNGLVLIWSFGLPFLPSWAGPAREGVRAALRTRPAINIALYSEGRLDGYWLEELDPADARWDGAERWRFGNSRFEITRRDGRLLLDAELDVRTPGAAESLQGQVTFDTVAARVEHGFAWDQRHAWTPLAGPGRADWALAECARFGEQAWYDATMGRSAATASCGLISYGKRIGSRGIGGVELMPKSTAPPPLPPPPAAKADDEDPRVPSSPRGGGGWCARRSIGRTLRRTSHAVSPSSKQMRQPLR